MVDMELLRSSYVSADAVPSPEVSVTTEKGFTESYSWLEKASKSVS